MQKIYYTCQQFLPENDEWSCSIQSGNSVDIGIPSTTFSLGAGGNVIALAMLLLRRGASAGTESVFYLLVVSLLVTDLLGQIGSSVIPLMTYAQSRFNSTSSVNRFQWPGGQTTCNVQGFVMVASGLNNILLVTLMSLERMCCLKYWSVYSRYCTRPRATATLAITATFSLLFSAIPVFMPGASYSLQFPGTWCFIGFHAEDIFDSFFSCIFASLVVVMILLTSWFNGSVVHFLITNRQKKSKTMTINKGGISAEEKSKQKSAAKKKKQEFDMELQMVVLLLLLTSSFIICWCPLMIQILVNEITKKLDYPADLLAIRMASINPLLDPWIYIVFRKSNFDRAFAVGHKLYSLCSYRSLSKNNDLVYSTESTTAAVSTNNL